MRRVMVLTLKVNLMKITMMTMMICHMRIRMIKYLHHLRKKWKKRRNSLWLNLRVWKSPWQWAALTWIFQKYSLLKSLSNSKRLLKYLQTISSNQLSKDSKQNSSTQKIMKKEWVEVEVNLAKQRKFHWRSRDCLVRQTSFTLKRGNLRRLSRF